MESVELLSRLDSIIAKLLVLDNAVIQQATAELKELVKQTTSILGLVELSRSSKVVAHRQYAAVILRKFFSRRKHWDKLSQNDKNNIKIILLDSIGKEEESMVHSSILQVIATIAQHELCQETNQWPELLAAIHVSTQSEKPEQRQMGLQVLATVSDVAAEELAPHLTNLLTVFSRSLQETNTLSGFYSVQSLTHFVPYITTEHVSAVEALLPHIVNVIKSLLTCDEDRAIEALDIVDELIECEVSVIAPHIQHIVMFCLEITSNTELSDPLRVKSLNTIGYLIRLKKKVILKHKLVDPILVVVFALMNAGGDEDEDDDSDAEEDDSSPSVFASQTLDVMAINLPPEKIVTPVLQYVETAIVSANAEERRAALLALAVVAEGAADHIRTKYLAKFLDWVGAAIKDTSLRVRNAALFALGQMCEHLQPDIAKHREALFPVLFSLLSGVHEQVMSHPGSPAPPGVDRVFYALEMFCEQLEEDLTPHLPPLMECILSMLKDTTPPKVQEVCLSAVSAISNACKEGISPYFNQILSYLHQYLQVQNTAHESEEGLTLQTQAIDTLGTLAKTVGSEQFAPLGGESIRLGLLLVSQRDDADLRRSIYALFASVSVVLKHEMEEFLPRIMELFLTSLKSSEEISTEKMNGSLSAPVVDLFDPTDSDEEDLNDTEADDDDEVVLAVSNAYLEEKEETCYALKEIANNVGSCFLPYLNECSGEVYGLIDHVHEDIRKAAVEASAQFTITFLKTAPDELEMVVQSLGLLIPKMCEMVKTDTEMLVAMACLESTNELIKECRDIVLRGDNHLSLIITAVTEVFKGKTACQDGGDGSASDDEDDSEDESAEQEAMLFEFAGEIIPSLITVTDIQLIQPHLNKLLPLLIKKTKKSCSVAERSFSVGTLSEIVVALESNVIPLVPTLLPVFYQSIEDKDEEVRSNAAFGIGVLPFWAKEVLYPEYSKILGMLSTLMAKEESARCVDNIAAAVARIVITGTDQIPLDVVFPGIVNCLPLKEDNEENSIMYQAICHVYKQGNPIVLQHLPQILLAAATIIYTKKCNKEAEAQIFELVTSVNRDFHEDFKKTVSEMPEECREKLFKILS